MAFGRIGWGTAVIAAIVLAAATPARALNPGCTCPNGTVPLGATTCTSPNPNIAPIVVPAICTVVNPSTPTAPTAPNSNIALNQSVGHLAASQQQLSFAGVQAILEGRRDQLQGTLGGRSAMSMMSGYSAFEPDETSAALGYAGGSQRSNPLARPFNKAPPAPAAPSFAVWAQGLGDWERDEAASAADLGHFNRTAAAQSGFDGTWQNVAGGALVLGMVGSWTASHVSYDDTPTTTNLEGPGVGLYGTYVKGMFSGDLTAKFDFLHLKEDFAGLAPPNALNLTNAGVSGNLQMKVLFADRGFFEPTGGFSFTRTMFGEGAAAIGLADASTLRLQAGARAGTTWDVRGVSVEPSLKALVYSNVVADGSSADAGASGIVPTDRGLIRGEVNPDVNLDFGGGYSMTLSGLVRFGDGMLGGSASVNLRKQW